MAEPDQWFVYETELFVAEVSKYLNDFELGALRHHLAREPFSGKPVAGASPLISIDYAGATVIYSVHPGNRTIALIQIGKATGKAIEVDANARSRLREIGALLRKGGYIAAGKEALEWLIELIKGGL